MEDLFSPYQPGEASTLYLRTFKDERTMHRLLQYPWQFYYEHSVNGRAHICMRRWGRCPGCEWKGYTDNDGNITAKAIEDGQRGSRKYLVPVLPVNPDGYGEPVWWKYGVKLEKQLAAILDMNPLDPLSCDMGISKKGKGFNTEYTIQPLTARNVVVDTAAAFAELEEKTPLKSILKSGFDAVWGGYPNFNDEPAEAFRRSEDTPPAIDSEGPPPFGEPPMDMEPPEDPWAPADEQPSQLAYDESTIRTMTRPQLLALYNRAGIEPDPALDTPDLADELVRRFGA